MTMSGVHATGSCSECELEASGRCPTCRHGLCVDHFPLEEHEPCASKLAASAPERFCYVCGAPVAPRQWSVDSFAHYIDLGKCAGCDRYVCDARHTRLRTESVRVVRDGLRGHRYHTTRRYCGICAPAHRLGGLLGVTWWTAGLASAVAAAFFQLHR
jgi:hypothetical protein